MSGNHFKLFFLCLPLLMLSACGEGWEAQKTDTYFPYGNKRTAGSGVVYVRAKMLPEKELKIEPVSEPVVQEPTPLPVADEIFNEAQTKGGAPMQKAAPVVEETPVVESPPAAPVEEVAEEPSVTDAVPETDVKVEEDAIDDGAFNRYDMQDTFEPASAVSGNELAASREMSAEQYIAQAPKQISIPEVKIIDAEDSVSAYQTNNRTFREQIADTGDKGGVVNQTYSSGSVSQGSEIVAPKKDFVQYKSGKGRETLNEIYSSPF